MWVAAIEQEVFWRSGQLAPARLGTVPHIVRSGIAFVADLEAGSSLILPLRRRTVDSKTLGIGLTLFAVVVLTAAQFLIKSRLNYIGQIPLAPAEFVRFLARALADIWLYVGFAGLVISSLCWYMAVSRIPLTLAYPLGALSYPIIFVGSTAILREHFSLQALIGNLLIFGGVLLISSAKLGS